jgi:transposase
LLCYIVSMNLDLEKLPDDARLSKQDITSLIDLVEQKYQEKIHYLEERIRLLQNELFGRKSEKRHFEDHLQLPLFQSSPTDTDEPPLAETIVVAEHNRVKRGRKPLPKDLPRVEIIHDITEEEKVCPCGATLSRIGEDICEKLDYVPAKIRVEKHVRYKYACKSCEGVEDDGPTVKIAPAPVALIPKSNATEGLVAHIAVSKFADGLPLYRQEKIFSRIGIDLPRATMANWLIHAARCCSPVVELLQNEICSGPLINMDESPLQVLKEPGRANTTKSYMWVFCGGQAEHPTVLYQYHPTRSGEEALQFLDDYRGFIQSDDYNGYDYLGNKKGIIHLGCWSHARRKFVDVVKVRKKHRGNHASPKTLADQALEYIGELYRIEKQIRQDQLTVEQIYQRRQEQSKPVLNQFKQWLDATEPLTPPKGLLGKAISYTLKNWKKLIVYITDGRLKPDNNVAENAIRPYVVGRKNYLFAGHPNGANAGATFYSLIETAKANGLEPFAYLRYLFKQLPLVKDQTGYRHLLPQYVDPKNINRSAND